jgi:hypothetical protein
MEAQVIKVVGLEGVSIFPTASPDVDDGISWDSMGNDAPHDGNGIGNQAGDHTDHGRSYLMDEVIGKTIDCSTTLASVSELLNIRRKLQG